MIQLFQFPTAFGLPNLSPFCVKVETFLRMADMDYEIVEVTNPAKGPKGKAPFIDDDGVRMGDSHLIIAYLQDKYGIDVDIKLSDPQRGLTLSVERLLDEHLYWTIVYSRWMEPANWPQIKQIFFGGMPPVVRDLLPRVARRSVKGQQLAHGIGRHREDEIYDMGREDIAALAHLLGDRPFYFGNQPMLLDAYVMSYVANIVKPPFVCPLQDEANEHPNLVAHSERMLQRYFAR